MGQKAKYSLRVDVFRFGPNNGHRSIGSGCPFGAITGSQDSTHLSRPGSVAETEPGSYLLRNDDPRRGCPRQPAAFVVVQGAINWFIGNYAPATISASGYSQILHRAARRQQFAHPAWSFASTRPRLRRLVGVLEFRKTLGHGRRRRFSIEEGANFWASSSRRFCSFRYSASSFVASFKPIS